MKPSVLLWMTALMAFAADPAQIELRKVRARTLLVQMDFAAALEEAAAVNRARPDDVESYQLMAAAQLELGDYAEAEKQLQWMLDLRIGKADAPGWLLVARFREAIGDIDGAIDAVNLAYSRLMPGQEREQRTLAAYSGKLQYAAGRLDLAERALEPGLAAGEPAALETLIRVRAAQGRRDDAIRLAERLTKAARQPRYLYLRAEVTGKNADYAAFETAARQASGTADQANRELVLYYAGRGAQPAQGLAIARREAARRHDAFTLDALAMALFASGQKDEARSTMERALVSGTRDPQILEHARLMTAKAAAR